MSTELIVTNDMTSALDRANKLTEGIASLALKARELRIVDDDTRTQCAELMADAKKRVKGLTDLWNEMKRPVNDIRNLILGHEKVTIAGAQSVATLCEDKLRAFDLAALAAKRKAEADLARKAEEQQREILEKQKELLAEGFVSQARDLGFQAMALEEAPVLPPAISKVAGLSVGHKYKWKVTDIRLVLKAIVEGKVALMHEVRQDMRPLVVIDEVVLNALVGRMGDNLRIPGVAIDEDLGYRSRG